MAEVQGGLHAEGLGAVERVVRRSTGRQSQPRGAYL